MNLTARLTILTLMGMGWIMSACGTKAMPSIFLRSADSAVPDHEVVKEGALEPILTPDGVATGVMAPANAIKEVPQAQASSGRTSAL